MSVFGEHSITKCASPSSSSLPLSSVFHGFTQLPCPLLTLLLENSLSIDWPPARPENPIRFKIRYSSRKLTDRNFDSHLLLQCQIHPPMLFQYPTAFIYSSQPLLQLVTDHEVPIVHQCPMFIAKVSFVIVQPSALPQDCKNQP